MEFRKVMFKIKDGSASYKKWKENKLDCKQDRKCVHDEGAFERSEKNREIATQIRIVFEPYLKEILAQFPQTEKVYK